MITIEFPQLGVEEAKPMTRDEAFYIKTLSRLERRSAF